MSDPPFDFGEGENGRKPNDRTLEAALSREARHVYRGAEYEWAAPSLAEFGAVIGNTLTIDHLGGVFPYGPFDPTEPADTPQRAD